MTTLESAALESAALESAALESAALESSALESSAPESAAPESTPPISGTRAVPRPRRAGRPAADVLAAAREVVDPALRAAVATLPAAVGSIAAYHLGWAGAGGAPSSTGADSAASGAGGKAVRPALVTAAATAVGGAVEPTVPAAVAVELVHNFSLLHDDVMDGDTSRRHRPTAWTVFGVGPAILAGDALSVLAADVLAAAPHPASGRAVRMLSAAVQELIEGQVADLDFERRPTVQLAECLAMAGGKTAALLGCATALGGLLGGGRPEQVAALDRVGRDLGLAFQLVDDLLGIWGDPAVTGKPVGSDLRHRKQSLPVVVALASAGPAAAELAALYALDREPGAAGVREPGVRELNDREVAAATRCVAESGARDWCRERIDRLLDGALARIAELPGPVEDLVSLAHLIARRDR